MKELNELINNEDPAFPIIQQWLKEAKNNYTVLPKIQSNAEKELLNIQVSTRSIMGAVIYETGGILIDNGWIRILGSGCEKLSRSIYEWNLGKTIFENKQSPYLLIADDVIGGYFAINGGGLGDDIGNVYYFAPDTLEWESLGRGYSDFVYWTLVGDLSLFYQSVRWNNWKNDLFQINTNQVFSFYPFLWTKEGKDIENASRKSIPIEENYFSVVS